MSADNAREVYVTPDTIVRVVPADSSHDQSQEVPTANGPDESQSAPTANGPDESQSAPTANGNNYKDTIVNSKVCWALSVVFVCMHKASANISRRSSSCSTFVPFNESSDTASAINTVKDHPITQNTKETLTQGTSRPRYIKDAPLIIL